MRYKLEKLSTASKNCRWTTPYLSTVILKRVKLAVIQEFIIVFLDKFRQRLTFIHKS